MEAPERTTRSIELRQMPDGVPVEAPEPNEAENDDQNMIQELPPVDGGPTAWRFLFASVILEALLWGYPLCYGVFQDYYSRQPQFEGNSNIPVIGTLSTSIYFLCAPLAMPLVRKYQHWQRHMVFVGWIACVLSTLGASFCLTIEGLIATQGIAYGFGFLLLYFPLLCMLNEWFVARRGFAYGVLYGGGGLSGAGLPFLLEFLLSRYGYQTTLRAIAIAQFGLVIPITPLVKGRLPASAHGATAIRAIDWSFLYKPLFYVFALSNFLQGFVYYIPALYLPSFASALGLSSTVGAMALAANNFATVLGQVGFGWMSDRVQKILLLVCLSSLVASLATFVVWGFAKTMASLIVFSLIYGWFAGGYVVFWPKFGQILSEDPQAVFSLMAFGRGIGNVVTGPVTAGLLKENITSGYGLGKFFPLIVFLGVLMFASSLGICGLFLGTQSTDFRQEERVRVVRESRDE